MFNYKGMPVTARIINAVQRVAKLEVEKQGVFDGETGKIYSFAQFSIPDRGPRNASPYITLGFREERCGTVIVVWYNKQLSEMGEGIKPDVFFGISPDESIMTSHENGVSLTVFESIYHLQVLHCILETFQTGVPKLERRHAAVVC